MSQMAEMTLRSEATASGTYERPADPCAFVIFGASGDLTKRLLMPAIYNLACDSLLPHNFAIIGTAKTDLNHESFREQMSNDIGRSRLVVEKPFGHDLESALNLNRELQEHWQENQIWRIDHYLGKETVQNVLAFRFANGIFEPLWNRHYIDHVQLTVAEKVGVEGRGNFYERSGVVRDM